MREAVIATGVPKPAVAPRRGPRRPGLGRAPPRRVRGVSPLDPWPRHGGGRDRHRRPEASRRLQEGPEDEGYEDDLDAPVVAHAGQRVTDGVEEAGVHDDVVDKDGVYDDPDDGEEAEADPEQRRVERQPQRHLVDDHGDDERDDERDERGPLGRHPDAGQQHEEHDYGYGRDQGRDRQVAYRLVKLLEQDLNLP